MNAPLSVPLEIRDLRTFSGHQLRELLEEEAQLWSSRLLWDYRPSIKLLMQYLDSRILPGLVALDPVTREIHGYCFSVYEAQKGVIGDLYTWRQPRNGYTTREVQTALLRPMLETLQNTPGIIRVESQLLLHDSGSLTPIFAQAGFTPHRRLFLQASLSDLAVSQSAEKLQIPQGLRLVRWTTSHFQQAAELIHRCYLGHGDSVINDQYQTVAGSLRFLHNIVRFPGCGLFDAEASWVLWDERSHAMQGMLLSSIVLPGEVKLAEDRVAHVTQICLANHLRGRGLGRMLLLHAAGEMSRRGFRAMTLTVTEENDSAVQLYRKMGFTTRTDFDAMIWINR